MDTHPSEFPSGPVGRQQHTAIAVALAICCCVLPSLVLGAAEDDLQLTISTPRSKYFLGEPVALTLTLTNTGVSNLSGDFHLSFKLDRLQIWRSQDSGPLQESVSKAAELATIKKIGAPLVALSPGGSIQSTLPVSYDTLTTDFIFPLAGTYTLQASLRFNHYLTQIQSNSVTLTVVDPLPADEAALEYLRTNQLQMILTPERDLFPQSLDPAWQQQVSQFATLFPGSLYTPYANDTAVPGTGTDLGLSKEALADPVVAGDTLIYRLRVVNNGPNDALGVTVTDTVPGGVTFNAAQSSPECLDTGGVVTCTAPALGVLQNMDFLIAVDVSAASGCLVTNTASVISSTLPDPDTRDNSSTATTTVVPPTIANAGEVFIYYGPLLTGAITLVEPIPEANSSFGRALAAGHLDGDNLEDLIVGVPYADLGGDGNAGEVHLFSAPDLAAQANLQERRPSPNNEFGDDVAAGDIDNDGIDDVVIGVPRARVGGSDDTGEVHVYLGTDLTSPIILREPATQGRSYFGRTVAVADINNDGFHDVIAAAPNATVPWEWGSLSDAGEVFVFLGPDLDTVISLVQPDSEGGAFFGTSLAAADFNGDGNDDVVVGAPRADPASAPGAVLNHGGVWIFWGPDLTTSTRRVEPSIREDAYFGQSVATGDVNGDGYPDLVVTALNIGTTPVPGEVFTFLGPGLGTALQSADPTGEIYQSFGYALVAGDFNGDGADDVVVGATIADVAGSVNAGRTHVFWGPDMAQVSTLTEPRLEPGARFGYALAAVDLNGDGQDELVVSASSGGAVIGGGGGVCAAGRLGGASDPPEAQLTVDLSPSGDVVLNWGESCVLSDVDYAVYEGVLGDFTSHIPRSCSTAGAPSMTLTPVSGNAYYIVVPRNGGREGSHGMDGTGAERLPGTAICLPQSITTCP